MSELSTTAQAVPAESSSSSWRSWRLGIVVAVIMIVLAMIGVGLTTTNSHHALKYWMWLVPVYGILCVGTAWSRGSQGLRHDTRAAARQVLHWLGIGVAMFLEFQIRRTGEETATASALNAVVLLALGCFLAGVHLEWFFAVVGVLLTLTMLIVAKAEQYQWIIFVLGGLVIVGLIFWHRVRARFVAKTPTSNMPT